MGGQASDLVDRRAVFSSSGLSAVFVDCSTWTKLTFLSIGFSYLKNDPFFSPIIFVKIKFNKLVCC